MNEEQMKQRTKEFAKQIIKLCRQLPNNREGRLIGNEMECATETNRQARQQNSSHT